MSQPYPQKSMYKFSGAEQQNPPDKKLFSFFSNIATKIKTTAVTRIQETTKVIKAEFEQKKQEEIKDVVYAPWENLPTKDPTVIEEVTKKILALPYDKRTMMNAPPTEESKDFQFDMETFLPIAQVALSKDAQLSRARFYLVPKYIKERQFWHNYFFRVWVIKQAYGLNQDNFNKTLNLEVDPIEPKKIADDLPIEEKKIVDNKNVDSVQSTDVAGQSSDLTKEKKSVDDSMHFASDFIVSDVKIEDDDPWKKDLKEELNQLGMGDNTTDLPPDDPDTLEVSGWGLEEELSRELQELSDE